MSVPLTSVPRETLESIVTQEIREGPAAIRETIDVVSTQVHDIANTIGISGRRRILAIGKTDGAYHAQYRLAGGLSDWSDVRGMYVVTGGEGEPSTLVWLSSDTPKPSKKP